MYYTVNMCTVHPIYTMYIVYMCIYCIACALWYTNKGHNSDSRWMKSWESALHTVWTRHADGYTPDHFIVQTPVEAPVAVPAVGVAGGNVTDESTLHNNTNSIDNMSKKSIIQGSSSE